METNPFTKHYKEVLKAWNKPSYFLKSPYFLGINPYPKQAELFDKFYLGNYREMILVAGMRCFTKDTLVYSNPEPKPITEVEKVVTLNGLRNATLIPQGKRSVYRVVTYSGREIKATSNQPTW